MTQLWQVKEVESVFQSDRFDLADYQAATSAYPRLSTANAQAAQDFAGQPAQDAFFDLYKASPRFQDPAPAALSPLRSLIERGRETPEWGKLRAGSVGDLVSAAVGAEVFTNQVMRALPQEVKEAVKKQARASDRASQHQADADAAREMADLLTELAGKAQAAGDQARADDLTGQAEAAQERAAVAELAAQGHQADANRFGQAAEQAMTDYAPQIQAALNSAAANANSQAQETATLVKSFSLAAGGDGYVDPASVQGIMRVMQQNPNLQKLAELLGWARQMARAEWRKSPHGHTQMTGYHKQALSPSKMASFEMARMVSPAPAIRQDWQRRAADNAVMHRQFEGEQEQGRGDMVIVRDESGSMAGPEHATAVALEWALLEIARRDKRGFVSVPFSGFGQYSVWRAPESQPDMAGLLAHLGHFYGGGTEPYAPIRVALAAIGAGDLKADILLLTDGSFADAPAEFLQAVQEARKDRPVKIVTVVIGGMGGDHQAKKFSDKVIFINDLFADREKLRAAVSEIV